MPQQIGKKVGVNAAELVPWYSYDALKKVIWRHKENTYGIKRLNRSSPGHQMLVDFDTLPPHIQDCLGDPRKVDHILLKYYKEDGEAVRFYSTYQFENGETLDMKYQERYIVNASVLKAAILLNLARIDMRRSMKGNLKRKKDINGNTTVPSIGDALHNDVQSFNQALKAKFNIEHSLPASERHFKRVLNDFETQGYISLISDKHGNQNTRKVTDETLSLLQSLFAGRSKKPNATEVHREYKVFLNGYIEVINNASGEVYNPADFKKLSDTTVKKYMASWQSKIGTYAIRSGNRQTLMQQFKPHHSLDKPKYAGSIISIDDRQPPFKMADGKRVWFYNGIDLGSEAFTCWVHGSTKEGIILEFYRQLVRNYAQWGFSLPAELEAEASLNSSYVNSFLREGAMFEHVRIEANNARGKRIERYFRTLRYEIEKERDGWLARPFALSESNQPGADDMPALPYSTIVENALTDIETWNNQPHSVHTHLSRWQVFCKKQHPDLKPTNYAAILPYIGYKTQTSCNVGIIRLDRKEFLLGNNGKVSLGANLINLMKQVEGQKIDVYWLDDNQGAVFKALVYIDDQLICEALPKPTYNRAKIEQGPEDAAARTIMSAYVATIEGYGRRVKQSIEKVTVIDYRKAQFNDFVMPGLKKNETKKESGGIMPSLPADDYDLLPAQSFVRELKDRF